VPTGDRRIPHSLAGERAGRATVSHPLLRRPAEQRVGQRRAGPAVARVQGRQAVGAEDRKARLARQRRKVCVVGVHRRRGDGDFDRLVATTIHGFYRRIVLAHAVEAGVDPGAIVMDGDEAGALFERVLSS
jgi:hypothetical protein